MTTLRRVAITTGGAGFPHAHQGHESGDLPFVKVSDFNHVGNETMITYCNNWVTEETARRLRATVVPAGSVLLPKVGAALLGNARRIVSQPSAFDNNILAVVPHDINSRYLHYWLTTVDAARFAKPGPVPSMDDGAVLNLRVPVVFPPVQRAITDYLDTETARIDALISKKRRLVELLQERRRALITAAVDPDRHNDQDPSNTYADGWLQPRNHQRRPARLRFLADVNPAAPGWESIPDHQPLTFLPLEAVWPGRMDYSRQRPKDEVASGYTRFCEGDVVVPKITPTFEADRSTLITGMPTSVGTGTTELHVIRTSPMINARYLHYLVSSQTFLSGGEARMIGVAGQKRVPDQWIRDYPVPVADLTKQRMIADYLDTETARIDTLVAKIARTVELLQERRSALITAAVTGKIAVDGSSA